MNERIYSAAVETIQLREGPKVDAGVAIRLSDFVLRRPATVFPSGVLRNVSYLLLDTIGIAAAPAPMDARRIARNVAAMIYGSNDPCQSARLMFDEP
jgi:2-methylcitrate dehydratase PrpD